jgi:tetratricopeptide (TPR) repeat protein
MLTTQNKIDYHTGRLLAIDEAIESQRRDNNTEKIRELQEAAGRVEKTIAMYKHLQEMDENDVSNAVRSLVEALQKIKMYPSLEEEFKDVIELLSHKHDTYYSELQRRIDK